GKGHPMSLRRGAETDPEIRCNARKVDFSVQRSDVGAVVRLSVDLVSAAGRLAGHGSLVAVPISAAADAEHAAERMPVEKHNGRPELELGLVVHVALGGVVIVVERVRLQATRLSFADALA